MIKNIRWPAVLIVWVVAMAATAFAQTSDLLEAVCATSQDLAAYSATIRMTQHQGGSDSEIEFTFDFVPPDRMRILYTAPATVEGQTMILNADRFYTYIPSLHRSVWQDAGDGGGGQGEEMGFLYDFVTRSASAALESAVVDVAASSDTYVLEGTGETLDVAVFSISTAEERQVVLLNIFDAAPVAITIYDDEELVMEICVLDYQINGAFDDAWFAIPEK